MASNNDFRVLLQAVLDSNSIGQDDINKIQKVISKYHLNLTADLDKASVIAEIKKIVPQLEAELKKMTGVDIQINDSALLKAFNQIEKQAESTAQKLNKIQHLSDTGSFAKQVSDATVEYNKLSTVTDDLKTDFAELQRLQTVLGTSQTDEELISNYEKFDTTLKKVKNTMSILRNEQNSLGINSEMNASLKSINTLANAMASFRDNNTKMTKDMKSRLDVMYKSLINGSNLSKREVDELRNRFSALKLEVRDARRLGKSFGDSIKSGMESFSTWLPASQLIMSSVNAFRDAIDNVKELDNSLLELSKVSDLSSDGLIKVTEEAYELGETVGRTGRQVVDAVTEFKRAGFELSDSMDMAEAALVMTNVAEGIDNTADAAGTLISVLKGYNMAESETMSIVDKINQASNLNPIGFDQIAEGLERTAGTMAQSGTTIDQTIGLLTAGYAQLRNVEKVSTGLITLSARLRGVGEDGEVIDGLSAKLQDDFGKIGVAIEDADGNLRSIYEIAQDYAKVLPTLSSKQKQYYAELAAGKRQVTVWNAITQQFSDAEKATADSINSLNSAAEENQKYLDSISGKISQFDSAIEHLSSTIIDSDLVKFFVDLGTAGVKAVDGLINALTPLGTLALGGGLFASFKNVGKRRSTMFHNCFEYADRDRCFLYKIGFLSPIVKYTLVNEATISVEII